MQTITPFLWYDGNAEEAVRLYTSVFPDSRVVSEMRQGEAGPNEPGSVLSITLELNGQRLHAMNGGPGQPFNMSVSLMVEANTQDEIDRYYDGLAAEGGEAMPCGWVKDRFGLHWQVTPRRLMELMSHEDPAIASKAAQAMFQMTKIDLAALEAAVKG
ncbi:MAG: VOC family protein [Phycisphaerales bacterium JB058]